MKKDIIGENIIIYSDDGSEIKEVVTKDGEIITDGKQIIKIINRNKVNFMYNFNQIKNKVKVQEGIKDAKDTYVFNWNNKNDNPKLFVKSYKAYQKEKGKDLNIFEEGIMGKLSRYIESETNKVLISNKNPTNKDLEKILGIGNSKLKETLSSLKDKKLISTQGRGLGREIYLNPQWVFDGRKISKNTLKLFKIDF